ncbi:carbohydrate-selective porin, OprB family [mine drainage metagenome]|uniref:Carbohydrate-selective porin, OprB family n=1 Tax=mine drainage metagenome TaxID=410659 RepID=A0A1J5RBK9_9ZZZZ
MLAALAAVPLRAAAGAALSTAGHLDVDAMASHASAPGPRRETSVLLQWGGRFDTGAAGWWRGGLFEFSVMGVRSSGTAGAGSGAVQTPSDEWAPDFARVYQASYRQDLGNADFRVGIMDLGQYFDASNQAALLHNGSFGVSPTVMGNFDGPSFPNPGLGAVGERRGADWSVRAGLWQGEPPALRGVLSRGDMAIAEVERDWRAGGAGAPRGDFKLGAWEYRHGAAADGPDGSGSYLIGETSWRRGVRRWGAFVLGGRAPGAGEAIRSFVACGLRLDAPLASRPRDQASVGLSRVALAGGGAETVTEAVYAWRFDPSLSIQPDLQYVADPGGVYAHAWIGGVRLHLAF